AIAASAVVRERASRNARIKLVINAPPLISAAEAQAMAASGTPSTSGGPSVQGSKAAKDEAIGTPAPIDSTVLPPQVSGPEGTGNPSSIALIRSRCSHSRRW